MTSHDRQEYCQSSRVKITDLTLSAEGIRVSGDPHSIDGVDTLKQAFAASGDFERVKVSQARADTSGKGVAFKTAITLKKA